MTDPLRWLAHDRGDGAGDRSRAEDDGSLWTPGRALALGVLAVLLAGTLTAGAAGFLAVTIGLVSLAAIVLAFAVPESAHRRGRTRPAPPVSDAAFRAYRQVAEDLSWGRVSPRHYDLTTRPLLARLAAARLAEVHRVDLSHDPQRAAELLGPDVWPWVNPAVDPSRNSQPPGVPRAVLARVIDRLENL